MAEGRSESEEEEVKGKDMKALLKCSLYGLKCGISAEVRKKARGKP